MYRLLQFIFTFFFTLLFPLVLWATRPFLSMDEYIEKMPIIFDGEIMSLSNVTSPVNEAYLYSEKEALAIRVKVSRTFKGINAAEATLYTWIQNRAPCKIEDLKIKSRYLFYAEWDKTKKYLLTNLCRGVRESTKENPLPDYEILEMKMNPRQRNNK